MPLDCHIDHSRRVVIATAYGAVAIEEWAACLAKQIREGGWTYATLFDFSGAESLPPIDSLPKIAGDVEELAAEHGPRGPVALLANPPLFEHVRRYSDMALRLPFQTAVFSDKAAAEAWVERHAREMTSRPM